LPIDDFRLTIALQISDYRLCCSSTVDRQSAIDNEIGNR